MIIKLKRTPRWLMSINGWTYSFERWGEASSLERRWMFASYNDQIEEPDIVIDDRGSPLRNRHLREDASALQYCDLDALIIDADIKSNEELYLNLLALLAESAVVASI